MLLKTLENPLDYKEIKPVDPKGNQPWIFVGRIDAEAEAPILWPPDAKSQLTGKDSDAGKDWGQEEKGVTEDELVGWHHWLNGHEFEQIWEMRITRPWGLIHMSSEHFKEGVWEAGMGGSWESEWHCLDRAHHILGDPNSTSTDRWQCCWKVFQLRPSLSEHHPSRHLNFLIPSKPCIQMKLKMKRRKVKNWGVLRTGH